MRREYRYSFCYPVWLRTFVGLDPRLAHLNIQTSSRFTGWCSISVHKRAAAKHSSQPIGHHLHHECAWSGLYFAVPLGSIGSTFSGSEPIFNVTARACPLAVRSVHCVRQTPAETPPSSGSGARRWPKQVFHAPPPMLTHPQCTQKIYGSKSFLKPRFRFLCISRSQSTHLRVRSLLQSQLGWSPFGWVLFSRPSSCVVAPSPAISYSLFDVRLSRPCIALEPLATMLGSGASGRYNVSPSLSTFLRLTEVSP
jgi:hypothetical protein